MDQDSRTSFPDKVRWSLRGNRQHRHHRTCGSPIISPVHLPGLCASMLVRTSILLCTRKARSLRHARRPPRRIRRRALAGRPQSGSAGRQSPWRVSQTYPLSVDIPLLVGNGPSGPAPGGGLICGLPRPGFFRYELSMIRSGIDPLITLGPPRPAGV
jgi:hypothetical protein